MTIYEIIANFIIPAIFALFTAYLVPILKQKKIYNYVKIGVHAAQQVLWEASGEEKYQAVWDFVKSKIKVKDEDLHQMIEAVVFEMKQLLNEKR